MAGDPDTSQRVCLGVVTGAHGLHGLLRVRPYTDVPEDIAAYGPVQSEDGQREFTLDVRNRTGKGQILVHIEGVDDRTAAEALKGEQFYIARGQLPDAGDDEFYHADLIGMAVVSNEGEELGAVRAVNNFGGGDMLEISGADGQLATVPFTKAAVPEIDLDARRVVVDGNAVLGPGNGDSRDGETGDG
ncbi:MAG: 16S rRNA processing protein RimM [Alphaproteobacteria bacterium]|nr:16S rRNA processing protein RimM [Alphaproteobacteria bacterium]